MSATFSNYMADTTHSITSNVLGIRTHNQEAGYASQAQAAQARRLSVARQSALLCNSLIHI